MTAKTSASPITERPSPPRYVVLAAGALLLSGLFAVGASATLFGGATKAPGGWLYKSSKDANDKLFGTATTHKKGYLDPSKLQQRIDATPKSLLITSLVVLVAVTILAAAAYRGKYWARWTTLGLWVMATITQTLAGIGSLLLITSAEVDLVFRIPAFLSGLLFVAAVVLTNLRPSVEFFRLNKPVRPVAGGTPQRRGMFAPREPRAAGGLSAAGRLAAGQSVSKRSPAARTTSLVKGSAPAATGPTDRGRAKARAEADFAAKGAAAAARSRAKASKSRRTGG